MILLDTHVLLWMLEGTRGKLGKHTHRSVQDPKDEFVVSAASFYEMALKERKGGLAAGATQQIADTLERRQLPVLDITPTHVLNIVADPPVSLSDPFDLLLVAQARAERLPLLTVDAAVLRLQVPDLRLIDGRK